MYRDQRISIVMPCHNEEAGLRAMLPRVPEWVDEVVIVDNASTDGSARVAEGDGAKVICEPRRGYGSAYRAGLPLATGDIIVTMDADDTYPIRGIAPMVDMLIDEDVAFVSGARFPLADRDTMSPVNRLGNAVLTGLTRLLFGIRLRDSQSGMWVFRSSLLDEMTLRSGGMPFSEEIKIEAIRSGAGFKEHPIEYSDRVGEVKLRRWRDGLENVLFLLRLRFRK